MKIRWVSFSDTEVPGLQIWQAVSLKYNKIILLLISLQRIILAWKKTHQFFRQNALYFLSTPSCTRLPLAILFLPMYNLCIGEISLLTLLSTCHLCGNPGVLLQWCLRLQATCLLMFWRLDWRLGASSRGVSMSTSTTLSWRRLSRLQGQCSLAIFTSLVIYIY